MDRRIASSADADLRRTLDWLTTPQPGRSYPIFETKQKALMFAAALGHYRSLRVELGQRDAGAAIRFDIFQKAFDDGFVNALAVDVASDLKILDEQQEDEVAKVFEEYSHGGLREIHRLCFENSVDPLDTLLQLAFRAEEAGESDEVPKGMDANIFRGLLG